MAMSSSQRPRASLAAFLEVDLGHERGPVWKEKVRNYLQLALSGEFERQFGTNRFRVLVLANSERRLHSIREDGRRDHAKDLLVRNARVSS